MEISTENEKFIFVQDAKFGNNNNSLNTEIHDRIGYLADKLVTSLHNQASLLKDYLITVQYAHNQPIGLHWKTFLKNLPPVLVSYVIGSIATQAYIGASQNAAGDDAFEYIVDPLAAVLLNAYVNGYFFKEVVSEIWDSWVTHLPKNFKKALWRLQNKNPQKARVILHGIKSMTSFAIFFLISLVSAYPFYALDRSESDDPEIISDLILLSSTMLLYKGVEAFIFKTLPVLFAPFQKLYLYCMPEKATLHNLYADIAKLKFAHKDVLENAHLQFLTLLQTGREEELQTIYALLEEKKPNLKVNLQLLLEVCRLAQFCEKHPENKYLKIASQIFGEVLTTLSLPGYFLKTESSAAEYFSLDDVKTEFLLGAGIYFMTIFLSYDVSWDVFGKFYSLFNYAKDGIKQNWQKSKSTYEFVKNALWGIPYKKSWHSIIRLPLSFIQSPKSMTFSTGSFYILSYWSAKLSTYLNEQQLGKTIADVLFLPTVIAVMVFNSFPVDKVNASIQRLYIRLFGSKLNKIQLNTEDYLKTLMTQLDSMDETKFLEMLNILSSQPLENQDKEDILQTLLGTTGSELFGVNSPYAHQSLRVIANSLIEKLETSKLRVSHSRFSLFSRWQKEKDLKNENMEAELVAFIRKQQTV